MRFVSYIFESRMTLFYSWLLSLLLTASIWQIWYVSTKSNPDLNDNLVFGALLGVIIQVSFDNFTTTIKNTPLGSRQSASFMGAFKSCEVARKQRINGSR